MKCTIPEISWHNRDPVLAIDIQPNPPDGVYRLATAGTDTHIVVRRQLWLLVCVEAKEWRVRVNGSVCALFVTRRGKLCLLIHEIVLGGRDFQKYGMDAISFL